MRKWFWVLVVIGMVIGAWAQSADLVIEAVGYGVTKNDAVAQAKREALAQGIGQMLTSQTEVENFMVKRDVILTQTMGHVKTYMVLRESQGPDGAWEVRIRATVAKDGLSKDLAALKILMQTIGNPRVAVLIQETNMGNTDPAANKAEMLLLDFLKSKEFRVVDPNQALRFRESPDGVKAVGGDPASAAKLGALLNAEVIIVGTAVAKESDVSQIQGLAQSGMKSASATVSLKAFNVSTREILAAKSAEGAMVHVNAHTAGNKAIEKAIQNLLSPKGGFFEALVESWRRGANDGQSFELRISGVMDFTTAKLVKQVVGAQVSGVEQRGFTKPVLTLEVVRSGSADDLCEALEGRPVGNQKLAVESVQGNVVEMSLK